MSWYEYCLYQEGITNTFEPLKAHFSIDIFSYVWNFMYKVLILTWLSIILLSPRLEDQL